MSRYFRMQNVTPRVWSPPQSPVRIEYSPDLLRQVRLESAGVDASGTLFGLRDGNLVRVLAVRRHANPKDPRLAGLDSVGSFAARARGEVFLTESDIERFESLDPTGAIALVVAGDRAGFFIPQPDGSMQTIRSFQEFAVNGSETKLIELEPPKFATLPSRTQGWGWITLAGLALCAIPFMVYAYLPPLLPRAPLGLTVHEELGQLRIHWNPIGIAQQARIEIIDGPERTTVPVPPGFSSATYVRRTGDIEVSLNLSEKGFAPRREAMRFVAPESPASPEIEHARGEIRSLEDQTRDLTSILRNNWRTVAALEKRIDAYRRH
jgi:hypothetical protein